MTEAASREAARKFYNTWRGASQSTTLSSLVAQKTLTSSYRSVVAPFPPKCKHFWGPHNEKGDCQKFWISLMADVFGMEDVTSRVNFEKTVIRDNQTKFIDVYIPESKVLIEQKGCKISLDAKEKQSGGEMYTPYEQAKCYSDALP